MNINQNDKNAIEKLKAQLSETTGVASKPWLAEKINELLQNNKDKVKKYMDAYKIINIK